MQQRFQRVYFSFEVGELLSFRGGEQFGFGAYLLLEELLSEFHLLEAELLAALFLLLEFLCDLNVDVLSILLMGSLANGGAGVVLEELLESI
jgi:hypothetical protein